MKSKLFYAIIITVLSMTFTGLLLVTSWADAATPITSYNAGWLDGFDSPTLDVRWKWVREDSSHWSLTDNPGFLRIITQPGGIFGTGNNGHNLLLTEASAGDYRITTEATISPTEDFQSAALIVYQDDDNYIRLGRRFANGGNEVNFRQEVNGSLVRNIVVSESSTTIFLRITKVGGLYSGYYSTDGSHYNYVGQIAGILTQPQIGIVSENGPSEIEIPSDYDFFQLEANVHQIRLPLITRS